MDIAILGAGSWGTALAAVLARNGHAVRLWTRRRELAEEINRTRLNRKYLPDCTVPEGVTAYWELPRAVERVRHIVVAVPSNAFMEVCRALSPHLDSGISVLHATKGIDVETGRRMSELLLDACPSVPGGRVAVLSGPSHAEEVIRELPTTVVVASPSRVTAEEWQRLFTNRRFRVYTHPDVIGVELGGSLKNIIAIGAGLSDGLGFGDNAKAALMTRGLHEMVRLGVCLGASPLTFAGLAGLGDLVVTCTSRHSRNRRAGLLLAKGWSLEQVLAHLDMAVEGVRTTRAAVALARRTGVDMPIAEAIFEILFRGADPKAAVSELMGRSPKPEWFDSLWGESLKWSEPGSV
ncbi:MAG: NAD(P)H-dependent glycerol-3-phosphate dehydrogenase [Alicyclobacillaceae bacterium]|nr:NAD(P)H-dependent glycerol-3-phosphate dehydrogenase [Alicyclobacillaceae bacterium]